MNGDKEERYEMMITFKLAKVASDLSPLSSFMFTYLTGMNSNKPNIFKSIMVFIHS